MQEGYNENLKPIFYSDNDSFLLILKNINYEKAFGEIVSNSDKKEDALKHSDISINMSMKEYARLMDYLEEPRTRKELQEFCNIKSREYFRTKILNPLIEAKRIDLTIPNKPQSSKQKYIKHKD